MSQLNNISQRLSSSKLNRDILIFSLAIVMGIIGGLGAVILKKLIELFYWLFYIKLLPLISYDILGFNLGYLFLPIIGGIIVGVLIKIIAEETSGSGVPQVLESTILKGGEFRARAGILKLLVTPITIGSGGSAGKEGPIAFTGATVGSLLANKLKLKPKERRLLITCGFAAGIAGMFDAPLGGAIFALEVLFQGVTLIGSLPVFLAAVIGTAFAGYFFGHDAIFTINFTNSMVHPIEYPIFIIIGAIFGFLGFGLAYLYNKINNGFNKIKITDHLRPALGGILTGIFIMLIPNSGLDGVGTIGIQQALDKDYTFYFLLLLGILKFLATSSTIGSGGSGGIFGPTLYIGCMFGGFFGELLHIIAPGLITHSNIYYLIGMSALFSGVAQAPLNVSIILIELTENFGLLPPLLLASLTSYLVGRFIFKGRSFYTYNLKFEGSQVTSDTIYKLENVKVGELMHEIPFKITQDISIHDFVEKTQNSTFYNFPVIDRDGRFVGILNLKTIFSIPSTEWDTTIIMKVMNRKFLTITPSDKVLDALDLMRLNKLKLLFVSDEVPVEKHVVDRYLKGYITYQDIIEKKLT